MFSYQSVAEIVALAGDGKISAVVLADQAAQMEVTEAEILARMRESLAVMRKSAEAGLQPGLRSVSGLSGGDGYKMHQHALGEKADKPLSGAFCAQATALAIGIQEYNAAMGKIVATPTAGSCGILPAGVLTMMAQRGASEESAVNALITAGAIGLVIATNATVSGASGGCQAECGSAAAMTAAALVEMMGGTATQCAHAAAIALQNQMGLVCDPVAGLVEVPCILRNGGGIMIAVSAADLAMAGVQSVIPLDEVITAMGEVGRTMPENLRETSLGGLATTPTGLKIKQEIFGE